MATSSFVGSYQGIVTNWYNKIFLLYAEGEYAEAMRNAIPFIMMQDGDIQKLLAKHRVKMERFLEEHEAREGVDFVMTRRSKRLFEEDTGKGILDEVLPTFAAILHKYSYFTREPEWEILSQEPGGVSDLRKKVLQE